MAKGQWKNSILDIRITRTKMSMHSYVYLSKMDKEVENIVKGCEGCSLAVKLLTQK